LDLPAIETLKEEDLTRFTKDQLQQYLTFYCEISNVFSSQ